VIGPEHIMARTMCQGPHDVVETLTRWADLARMAGCELAEFAAVVTITTEGSETSMAARSFFAEDLSESDDAELLAVLAAPAPSGELLVVVGCDGHDDETTTLSELQRGAQMQRQADAAGLS
jgi:hypothetical protein